MTDRDKMIELIKAGRGCPEGMGPFEESECLRCRYADNPDCDLTRLTDYLLAHGVTVQRWIPVTERLPEPEKRVLILTKCKGWNGKEYRGIMCGFYEDGNVWCEDSKCCWDYEMKREENYDESRDDYRVPEGWFEELLNHIDDYNCVTIGEPVTHWMPLPEPPEENEK